MYQDALLFPNNIFFQPSSSSSPWRRSGTAAGLWQTNNHQFSEKQTNKKTPKILQAPNLIYSTSFHFPFPTDFRGGFLHLMGNIFTNAHFTYFKYRRKQKKYRTTHSSTTGTKIIRIGQKHYLPIELDHQELNTYAFHMHKKDMQKESSEKKTQKQVTLDFVRSNRRIT